MAGDGGPGGGHACFCAFVCWFVSWTEPTGPAKGPRGRGDTAPGRPPDFLAEMSRWGGRAPSSLEGGARHLLASDETAPGRCVTLLSANTFVKDEEDGDGGEGGESPKADPPAQGVGVKIQEQRHWTSLTPDRKHPPVGDTTRKAASFFRRGQRKGHLPAEATRSWARLLVNLKPWAEHAHGRATGLCH